MERLKNVISFVLMISFALFAAFVINHCDCETSIFDDLPADALKPVDADYRQI